MKYIVRTATEEDSEQIADFFNRNSAYQVDTEGLSEHDVQLSFDVKEIKKLFLLMNDNKIVGTSGMFDFVFEGTVHPGSTYSGFLLIDPSVRDGTAIRTLYESLQQALTGSEKTFLAEINVDNKASMQLSRLNGYTLFDESWEDAARYILLRSDLSKIRGAFQRRKRGQIVTGTKIQLLKAIWVGDSYVASFQIDGMILTVYINGTFPWKIESEDFSFEFNENTLSGSYNQTTITDVNAHFENEQSTAYTNGIVMTKTTDEVISVSFTYNRIETVIRMSQNEKRKAGKPVVLPIDHPVLSKATVDMSSGDITYWSGDVEFITDLFPRFWSGVSRNVSVKHDGHMIILTVLVDDVIVKKEVTITDVDLNNRVFFEKGGVNEPIKAGLYPVHDDYYLLDKDVWRRFISGVFPEENMDFLKADKFDAYPKEYAFPDLDLKISLSSNVPSSNQMRIRPLMLMSDVSENRYVVHVEKLSWDNKMSSEDSNPRKITHLNARSESNNHPHVDVTTQYMPVEALDFIEMADGTKKFKKMPGDYTGVYFDIKSRGETNVYDGWSWSKLLVKHSWFETGNELVIEEVNQNRMLRILAEDGAKIFVYKVQNKLLIKIIFDNSATDRENLTFKLLEENHNE